ncbi:MAG TPA: alpha/beta fold hydrolase [Gammaproteobacteria bacterium]|nr:alpha/beta fold hydrolase [Gammaproteobacteria bacterium]
MQSLRLISKLLFILAFLGCRPGLAQAPGAAPEAADEPPKTPASTETAPGRARAPELGTPDLAREQRWAEQIRDDLLEGDWIELKAGERAFGAILTRPPGAATERAAVILHGMGAHPDWQDIIHPLRTGLPEQGWTTLSIQLPVLGNEAGFADYLPLFDAAASRIDAAVNRLHEDGFKRIVLIGHSLGANMAAWYLGGTNKRPRVSGLVLVSVYQYVPEKPAPATAVPAADAGQPGQTQKSPGTPAAYADVPRLLKKITLPVLDIYGSRDFEPVMRAAPARRARAAGGYRQVEVEGADHFFTGMQDTLLRQVRGWLYARFVREESTTP